jgi:hypothetical protein
LIGFESEIEALKKEKGFGEVGFLVERSFC